MTILYCQETPNLKLGPGTNPNAPDVVVFRDGYAEIDPADPLYAAKIAWCSHPGSPLIRILDEEEAVTTDPDAVACPVCGKAFATEQKLNGHLIHHRRKE